tara:strand:- start:1325 stop:1948 length:624 start_codon:yes stop_codon:yes gene_type:complete
MVTIIDYGVGNIGSIANMIKKVGGTFIITSNPEEVQKAEKIVLCGIGAFDDGMNKLKKLGLIDVLNDKVLKEKTPILGICLGMQLMTNGSEEGKIPGFGFIDAETKKFNFNNIKSDRKLRIPHMGWNISEPSKPSKLMDNMYDNPRFYFVHGYYVELNNKEDELTLTQYGTPFTSAFEKDNIIGTQFHPEKSHKYGMKLYENFIKNY